VRRTGGAEGVMSAGEDQISLPITGGCNCGAVRFEVSEPFEASMYCHCTRCQRRTGTSASVNGRTTPDAFAIVSGGAAKFFCADCGSALFSRSPNSIGVRLGAVDGDPGIRPSYRQYTAYAAAWEPIPDDGLPRHPEARPAS
jgi:hypothetical protein